MHPVKYILPISLALLLLSLSACKGEEEKIAEIPAVPVMVRTPEVGTITEWFRTTCEIRSPLEARVSFPGGGRIIELAVDEGDAVVAGQYLGKVDTSTLSAQYSAAASAVEAAESQAEAANLAASASESQVLQARAVAEQMETDYKRFQILFAEGVATQAEFEQIELGYESAQLALQAAVDGADAAWAQAESALAGVGAAGGQATQIAEMIEDGTLRAPFGGRIAGRMAEPGTVVGPGTPVFRIIGEGETVQNQMEVVFDIPESTIDRVHLGATLYLDLLACEEEIIASVDRIGPEVKGDSRTIEIIAYIPMDSTCLIPGMFGTVRIPLEVHEDAILVPEDAVLEFEDVKLVYIADGEIAVRREVRTGIREEGIVEIIDGITSTDEVIVVGNSFLTDGAKIEIRDETGRQMSDENPVMGDEE